MSLSKAKREKHLEDVAIGAGFLLEKLRSRYGASFGEGMWQQVNACINDCNEIGRVRQQREKAKSTGEQP